MPMTVFISRMFNSQVYNVKFNKAAIWQHNIHKDIVVGNGNSVNLITCAKFPKKKQIS